MKQENLNQLRSLRSWACLATLSQVETVSRCLVVTVAGIMYVCNSIFTNEFSAELLMVTRHLIIRTLKHGRGAEKGENYH